MEAVRISETLVLFNESTRRYISEYYHLQVVDVVFKEIIGVYTENNTRISSSFPFPFVPLQRRGCLVAPLFL
jgi:hypothetical protein